VMGLGTSIFRGVSPEQRAALLRLRDELPAERAPRPAQAPPEATSAPPTTARPAAKETPVVGAPRGSGVERIREVLAEAGRGHHRVRLEHAPRRGEKTTRGVVLAQTWHVLIVGTATSREHVPIGDIQSAALEPCDVEGVRRRVRELAAEGHMLRVLVAGGFTLIGVVTQEESRLFHLRAGRQSRPVPFAHVLEVQDMGVPPWMI
jgi:hypothetical protein